MALDNGDGDKDVEYQAMQGKARQGGFKATYFIYAMMGLDNIGFIANFASLVLYFFTVLHFDISGSANTTTNFLGTTFLLTLVGGFISDTYMNRLNTAILFDIFQLLGYLLITIQSHYKHMQPDACGKSSCIHGGKALLFYSSILFLALGGGGIRGVVPALGADQFDYNDPKEHKHIATFFNWFLLSITVGASLGVTFVVYIATNVGWSVGFIISMSCSFLGLICAVLGRPYYRVRIPGDSPLTRALEVFVVAIKNWRVKVPQNPHALHESRSRSSEAELIRHSDRFKFLDKAAVLETGAIPERWKVCTVTQVEEVKMITMMIPILLSTVLMNTCLAQLQTFCVQQGTLMNTKLGNFHVPPATIPVIPLIFMSILIPVYQSLFVPMLRKITGHPDGITHLQRVGVGLVLSVMSMATAGIIEVKRKNEFNHHGVRINLFWLSFQYGIFGIADMFTFVGLMEFFYKEAPPRMRSLSTSFSWLSISIGYFLSTAFVDIINSVSGKFTKNKIGWLKGLDMNKNHLEYFYWFLAVISTLNFANYLFWTSWYKYRSDDSAADGDEMLLGKDNASGMTNFSFLSGLSPQEMSTDNRHQQQISGSRKI